MDLGKMTDEQLIELLREGKTEITDYLMEKYKDMVRKQARAMYLCCLLYTSPSPRDTR